MIRPATFLVAAVFLQCSTVLHAQTEVPNTFEAGQPARASEVNDNFETLESAINQNTGILDQIQGTATLSNEARQRLRSVYNQCAGQNTQPCRAVVLR